MWRSRFTNLYNGMIHCTGEEVRKYVHLLPLREAMYFVEYFVHTIGNGH